MRSYPVSFTVLAPAALALTLALATSALQAADTPPPAPMADQCAQNPEACLGMQERAEQWCKANPEQCEKAKQRRAERKEWCEKNPKECAERKEQRRKQMEEMRQKCQADPAKCEEMRQHMHERMQEHMDKPPGASPPQI